MLERRPGLSRLKWNMTRHVSVPRRASIRFRASASNKRLSNGGIYGRCQRPRLNERFCHAGMDRGKALRTASHRHIGRNRRVGQGGCLRLLTHESSSNGGMVVGLLPHGIDKAPRLSWHKLARKRFHRTSRCLRGSLRHRQRFGGRRNKTVSPATRVARHAVGALLLRGAKELIDDGSGGLSDIRGRKDCLSRIGLRPLQFRHHEIELRIDVGWINAALTSKSLIGAAAGAGKLIEAIPTPRARYYRVLFIDAGIETAFVLKVHQERLRDMIGQTALQESLTDITGTFACGHVRLRYALGSIISGGRRAEASRSGRENISTGNA